jgi:hypothetical protein
MKDKGMAKLRPFALFYLLIELYLNLVGIL